MIFSQIIKQQQINKLEDGNRKDNDKNMTEQHSKYLKDQDYIQLLKKGLKDSNRKQQKRYNHLNSQVIDLQKGERLKDRNRLLQ